MHGKRSIGAALALALASATTAVHAADDWTVDLTPYLWAASIDGKITVKGNTVHQNADFTDVAKNLDFGGAFIAEANKGHWVNWVQFDYIAIDNGGVQVGPAKADMESKSMMAAIGTGWRFDGFGTRSTVDVLVGVRYLGMDDTYDFPNAGHINHNLNIYDGILTLRPRVALGEHWTFSPTLSVGTGDSDVVWEASPQLEYTICDTFELRFGYRNLSYKLDRSSMDKVDVSFRGPIIGLGYKF